MKKLFILAFAVVALAACNKDEEAPAPEVFDVISFEPAEKMIDLETNKPLVLTDVFMSLYDSGDYTFHNVFCGKEYLPAPADSANPANYDAPLFSTADGSIRFGSYYAAGYDAWAGFAISTSADRSTLEVTSKSQFSVWASNGATASPTFAACYDMNTGMEEYGGPLADYGWPTIEFVARPRVVDHLWVANSTWVATYSQGKKDDSYAVRISGELRGKQVGQIDVTLISGADRAEGWQRVSLAAFGEVDKLVFRTVSTDAMCPTYFCIDEIALKRITDK